MDESSTIFPKIIPMLKEDNKGDLCDASIEKSCNRYKKLLDRVDNALSHLHKKFPTEDELPEAREAIIKAVKLAAELGLSITPKWHLFAVHCYPQHERLVKEGWGGLFILNESFVEKSHQRMLSLMRRMRGLRVYKQQQLAAAKIEHRSKNPNVSACSDVHRQKKKRRADKKEAKEQAKRVKRENAMDSDEEEEVVVEDDIEGVAA